MKNDEHKERHRKLHAALDELIADWIYHTGNRPTTSTVYDLMVWSHGQVENPTETANKEQLR